MLIYYQLVFENLKYLEHFTLITDYMLKKASEKSEKGERSYVNSNIYNIFYSLLIDYASENCIYL